MYQQIRRAFVASALALFCFAAYAQQTIKGTVKDANGEPMIGVTIATGSGAGAVTDLDGNFTIQNASPSTVLNISYVGYKSQQVKVGSQSNFNIVLQEDNTTLEDVVVIGYGTMKRKDLTGAVASVTGEKLAANPVANVAQALQGQLPGVSVASQDGRPGATMSIRAWKPDTLYRIHLPLAARSMQQGAAQDITASEPILSMDAEDAPQRTAYMESNAESVWLEFTVEQRPRYVDALNEGISGAVYPQARPGLREDLAEQLPHIAFTPYLRSLAAELSGNEKDPG